MKYTNSLETHNGKVGKIGEDFAVEFLESKGDTIVCRNFKNKIGEIDIVSATIDGAGREKLHIVEVKTSMSSFVRAEENMHSVKLSKVARLAEIFASNYKKSRSKEVSYETTPQDTIYSVDFVGVNLNPDLSLKNITYLENLEIY